MEHIARQFGLRGSGPRRALPLLGAALLLAFLAALAGAGVGDGADPPRRAVNAAASLRAAATPTAPTRAEAAPTTAAGNQDSAAPVEVRLETQRAGAPVPSSYLGLSFEAADLSQIAAYGAHGDLPALLRSLGPGLLRFGGISADTRVAWREGATAPPSWAMQTIGPADLKALRLLAERSGWRVLLTVGLAHYEPQAAASEVAAASRLLGPWLAGIEIGNEPDAYARHSLRSLPWSFLQYSAEVQAYRQAIAKVAPGVPFAGPGVSGSHVFTRWGPREAARLHPFLLTGHHYPLGCRQVPAPSIERLLSPEVRQLEEASLGRYMAVARASGVPFRMDEANSVSCGGRAGISNTFASALWASGYIGETLASGAQGINLQGNPGNCNGYTPVCAASAARLQSGALSAQPIWYALALTRGLAGDRPLHTLVSAPPGSNMLVRGLRSPSGTLQFLIVDYEPPGTPAAQLVLHVGAGYHAAAVANLTARSPEATSGVRLAGAAVNASGALAGSQVPHPPVEEGAVRVSVPASSAALVTVGG
jgi:hypothetical protein